MAANASSDDDEWATAARVAVIGKCSTAELADATRSVSGNRKSTTAARRPPNRSPRQAGIRTASVSAA
jgi:hypothetical protein